MPVNIKVFLYLLDRLPQGPLYWSCVCSLWIQYNRWLPLPTTNHVLHMFCPKKCCPDKCDQFVAVWTTLPAYWGGTENHRCAQLIQMDQQTLASRHQDSGWRLSQLLYRCRMFLLTVCMSKSGVYSVPWREDISLLLPVCEQSIVWLFWCRGFCHEPKRKSKIGSGRNESEKGNRWLAAVVEERNPR